MSVVTANADVPFIDGINLATVFSIYETARKGPFRIIRDGYGQIEYTLRGVPFRIIDIGNDGDLIEEPAKTPMLYGQTFILRHPGTIFEFAGENWIAQFRQQHLNHIGFDAEISGIEKPGVVRGTHFFTVELVNFVGDETEMFDDLIMAKLAL